MTLTIRQHWINVANRHVNYVTTYAPVRRMWCAYCQHTWPCQDNLEAVAAIRALDEAKIIADVEGIKRIILDYPPDADPAPPTENITKRVVEEDKEALEILKDE